MRAGKTTSYKCLRDDFGTCALFDHTGYPVAAKHIILSVSATTDLLRNSAALFRRCNTLPRDELNLNIDYMCLGMVCKPSCGHYVINPVSYAILSKLWVNHLVYARCQCYTMYPPDRDYQHLVYYAVLANVFCNILLKLVIFYESILSHFENPPKRTHPCKDR